MNFLQEFGSPGKNLIIASKRFKTLKKYWLDEDKVMDNANYDSFSGNFLNISNPIAIIIINEKIASR